MYVAEASNYICEMVNLGINGFNRAAEMIIRASTCYSEISVTAISDNQIDIDSIIYLIKYDSERGNYMGHVEKYSSDTIFFNGGYIRVFRQKLQDGIPWSLANVKYVVDVTGWKTNLIASFHLTSASVKKVIINSPVADIPLIVLGINNNAYRPDFDVISSGSSSTYCLALLIKLLDDNFEVEHCTTTNINLHSSCLITSNSDLRKAYRYCKNIIGPSIVPDDTVQVIEQLMPHLTNKLCGLTITMPQSNVSILDMTVKVKQNTSLSNIFEMVKKQPSNLLSVMEGTITSSNVRGQRVSCILDKDSSISLNNRLFKLICWYDNEYSEACRILELIIFINKASNVVSSLKSSIYQDNYMLRTNSQIRKSISKYLLSHSMPNLSNIFINSSELLNTNNLKAKSKEVQILYFSQKFVRYYNDNTIIHTPTKGSTVDFTDSSLWDGFRIRKESAMSLTFKSSISSLINQRLRCISKTIARNTNILSKSSHSNYPEYSDSFGTAGSNDFDLQITNREIIFGDEKGDDIDNGLPQTHDVLATTNTDISRSSERVDNGSVVILVSRECSNCEDNFSFTNVTFNDSECVLNNTKPTALAKSDENTSAPSYLNLPIDDFADSNTECSDDVIFEAYESCILFNKKEVGMLRRNISLNDNQENNTSFKSCTISEIVTNADEEFDKLNEICKWLEISNDFSDHEYYSIVEKVQKSRCN